MKDARIRRRPAEKSAIIDGGAQCFCLSDGNLGFEAMADRYVSNWRSIVEASSAPGPFLYSVRAGVIVRLTLD